MASNCVCWSWQLNIPSSQKIVLLCLAENANNKGCLGISVNSIAQQCHLSSAHIRDSLKELYTRGIISQSPSNENIHDEGNMEFILNLNRTPEYVNSQRRVV